MLHWLHRQLKKSSASTVRWQFKRVQYVNRREMNYLEIYVPARTLLTRRNLSSKHRQGTSHSALTLAEVWRSEGARHCFICRSPVETRRKHFTIYICVCACACVCGCLFMHGTMWNSYQQVFFFCLFYACFFFSLIWTSWSQKRFDFIAQLTKGEEQTRALATDQNIAGERSDHQQWTSPPPHPPTPNCCAGGNTHDSVYKAINPL